MSVNSIRNYGYYPQVAYYNASTPNPYQGQIGFYGAAAAEQLPEEQPEEQKQGGAKGLLVGTGLAAGAIFLLTKGKGKGLLTKLRNLFKGSKTSVKNVETLVIPTGEEVKVAQKAVKPQKVKVKPQRHIIDEHVNLPSGRKLKIQDAGGKEAIHKARRNEKQIIQKMLEQAEAEQFTAKDLAKYQKSLGKPATPAQQAFMTMHNKPAAETMSAIFENNGLKVVDGKLVKEVAPQVVKPVQTVSVDAAKLLEEKAKLEGLIAKYSRPGMERWAKPYIQSLQKVEEQLAKMNS